jgi:hypothetical protein
MIERSKAQELAESKIDLLCADLGDREAALIIAMILAAREGAERKKEGSGDGLAEKPLSVTQIATNAGVKLASRPRSTWRNDED